MKKDTSHKEELEKISPLLAKLKKEDPGLKVPANYFHNMQVDVMQQLKEEIHQNAPAEPTSTTTGTPWYAIFFSPKLALAFSTLLVIGIAVYWFSQPGSQPKSEFIAMDDLSQEEILEYIEENISFFEAEDLAEVAPSPGNESAIFQNVELDDEAVDEYLDKIIDDLDEESFENIF